MKREDILAMPAGRELDGLVALHVTDWVDEVNSLTVPHYSTDISAAWEVVEKFYYSDIRKLNGCNWGAWFGSGDGHSSNVTSVTAPEAICKAALLAVLEESQ